MSKTQSVGFSITGEFITEHARRLIQEGRPSKAWDIIAGCLMGISLDQAAQVLCGRMKLEGTNEVNLVEDDPKAPEPSDFLTRLLKDADEGLRLKEALKGWRDTAGICHLCYNRPAPARGSPAGLMSERVAKLMATGSGGSSDAIPQLLMELFPPFSRDEEHAFWKKHTEEMRELVDEAEPWSRIRRSLPAVPDAAVKALDRMLDSTPREKPKKGDIKKNDNGWLLPDGSFYPCGFMGHGQLACDLGVDSDKAAEKLGWVRCGMSDMSGIRSVMIERGREATQAQINKVDLYCTQFGMELPEWAGGKGSGFKHLT